MDSPVCMLALALSLLPVRSSACLNLVRSSAYLNRVTPRLLRMHFDWLPGGTGKTYLLTKAFELYGRCQTETLDIRVLSLSQATNPNRLMEWVWELLKSAAPSTLTVVILDEVNATDAVEFCKRLMVDRVFENEKGQPRKGSEHF